jgi:beta-lactamase superfamily II metal-dependent hydrolase
MPKLALPDGGVAVRMYRQGHGDCFLLALPRQGGGDPVYVLIDCGYKPGSPAFLKNQKIGDVVAHIGEATGNHLDLMVITHEHQDHLNGIWKKVDPYFEAFQIDEAWMAWTENPADDVANDLRRRHKDVLIGLVAARNKLALAAGDDDSAVHRLNALLSLEFGGEEDAPVFAVADPADSVNKQAMKLVKDKANQHRGVNYLRPGEKSRDVPGTAGIRAFVLGPPRNADLLRDEDPVGEEGFPRGNSARGLAFAAAASAAGKGSAPFSSRHCIALDAALGGAEPFFVSHYGRKADGKNDVSGIEVPENADWRRIDDEWLYSAESLALAMNTGVNNTSLVLAFELPQSKKILLFAGDAQRGNWISWADQKWNEGNDTITTRDLLARTVLYKVGHHGSHNATLAGSVNDTYANLSWMAQGEFAGEFTAMITAVNEWAVTKNDPPWYHPLPSIRRALLKKAQGRVFQTDIDKPARPASVPDDTWSEFSKRATFEDLYFDYIISDS